MERIELEERISEGHVVGYVKNGVNKKGTRVSVPIEKRVVMT